jgi:transposase
MSNVLKVSHQEAIRGLHQKGWSKRRIARELGIHRQTVSRYSEQGSKCTGISIAGSESVVGKEPVVSIAGRFGRKSWCEPFEETIGSKMEAGLSAQRIYQDLVEEKRFAGSYQSVCRFVRRLKARQPQRVWRIECQPGEEMQVDFGLGAPIEQDDGKTRRSWVLRVVLSYSRKAYSEAVMRQDTESFLRCLENGLRHFGGAPLLLSVDNLKAAVLKADWFDPQINPKLAEFCRHYSIHLMPCRPRMPQHKGKIEREVSYVRGNALKGDASSRWLKRTSFCANGKRMSPTNAFTARLANRWPPASKRNGPICSRYRPRFFRAIRRPGAA